MRKERQWLAPLLVAAIVLSGCDGASDDRGHYWCVTGSPDKHPVGSCSAHETSCRSRLKLPSAEGRKLSCKSKHVLAYELRWTSKYGDLEAWFVDEATCERERAARGIKRACRPSPWSKRGKMAH